MSLPSDLWIYGPDILHVAQMKINIMKLVILQLYLRVSEGPLCYLYAFNKIAKSEY
jgi:hypothetical protein